MGSVPFRSSEITNGFRKITFVILIGVIFLSSYQGAEAQFSRDDAKCRDAIAIGTRKVMKARFREANNATRPAYAENPGLYGL